MVKLTEREMAIAKIAWAQGYGYGHNHTVEGHYAPPEDYDWDILMEQLSDDVFDNIPDAEPEKFTKSIDLPQSRGTTTGQLVAMHLSAEEEAERGGKWYGV